mgnify:CR=1 FL=1
MIAIGHHAGPGVMQHEDRWGRPVESYEAVPWFWLDEATWEKVQWFQTSIPLPKDLDAWAVLKDPEHPIHREIKAKVVYGGMSMLKQMNVTNMDGEQMRIVIPMGTDKFEPHYRPWSLFERTIGYQLSKLKARRLSK